MATLSEEQKNELLFQWVYLTGNRERLAEEYGISQQQLWEITYTTWSYCSQWTSEYKHRMYRKFVGPLGEACPCGCGRMKPY
jgi:hypothetical protein